MADLNVDQVWIYPIKSLGGVSVAEILLTDSGPEFDRRWTLVDDQGVFITQRKHPRLSQCRVQIVEPSIVCEYDGRVTKLPLSLTNGPVIPVQIWNDTVAAIRGPKEAEEWFSDLLNFRCIPVYMPDDSFRTVNEFFAPEGRQTTFTDGFPILVTSTSSLTDLNRRLESPVPMGRFRPNVVISGGRPFAEDAWGRIAVGNAVIRGVKPCSRCIVTTIDPNTLSKGKEPLRTLASYRKWGNHVYFGENFIVESEGEIRVGDCPVIQSIRTTGEVVRSRI